MRSLLITLLLLGCDTDSVQFTGWKDQTALDRVLGTWVGPDSLTLTLAQDGSGAPADGCDVAHVVSVGQDDETISDGIGLGSCPLHVVAEVVGSVANGPYGAGPRAVSGRVVLGTVADGEALYDPPYVLDLRCDAPTAPCLVRGTFEADGYLTLTYQDGRALGSLHRIK